jgi:hypothetical protein
MNRLFRHPAVSFQPKPRRLALILGGALLLGVVSGCAGSNVREEGFSESELSQSVRQARPEKKNVDYWSPSEKGRQIERNLHSL